MKQNVPEHRNHPNRLSLAVFVGPVHFAMDWLVDLGGWTVSMMKIVKKTLAVGVEAIPYYGNYTLRVNSSVRFLKMFAALKIQPKKILNKC